MQITKRKWKGGHRGYLKSRIETHKREREGTDSEEFKALLSRMIARHWQELDELNDALEVKREERASHAGGVGNVD